METAGRGRRGCQWLSRRHIPSRHLSLKPWYRYRQPPSSADFRWAKLPQSLEETKRELKKPRGARLESSGTEEGEKAANLHFLSTLYVSGTPQKLCFPRQRLEGTSDVTQSYPTWILFLSEREAAVKAPGLSAALEVSGPHRWLMVGREERDGHFLPIHLCHLVLPHRKKFQE